MGHVPGDGGGSSPDLAIYAVHAVFWCVPGSRGPGRGGRAAPAPATSAPAISAPATAPYSRLVLAVHFMAFGVMYMGLGAAVIPGRVPVWFRGQRIVGILVIAAGAFDDVLGAALLPAPGAFGPRSTRATQLAMGAVHTRWCATPFTPG